MSKTLLAVVFLTAVLGPALVAARCPIVGAAARSFHRVTATTFRLCLGNDGVPANGSPSVCPTGTKSDTKCPIPCTGNSVTCTETIPSPVESTVCTAVMATDGFKCMKPDPATPLHHRYSYCSGTPLVATGVEDNCVVGQICNPNCNRECVTAAAGLECPPRPQLDAACTAVGYFSVAGNPQSFQLCSQVRGGFTKVEGACPANAFFDPISLKCTKDKPFACVGLGRFADPKSCTKYYSCTGVAPFTNNHLSCLTGHWFDAALAVNNYPCSLQGRVC